MSGWQVLRLDDARRIVAAGERKAQEIEVPMAICVSDAGGEPLLIARMDGASVAAGRTVAAKARTAIHFGRPTAETLEKSRLNPEVYGSFMTAGKGDWVLSMGGIPLTTDGAIVGAVAASGGTGEQDVLVAEAAYAAWSG